MEIRKNNQYPNHQHHQSQLHQYNHNIGHREKKTKVHHNQIKSNRFHSHYSCVKLVLLSTLFVLLPAVFFQQQLEQQQKSPISIQGTSNNNNSKYKNFISVTEAAGFFNTAINPEKKSGLFFHNNHHHRHRRHYSTSSTVIPSSKVRLSTTRLGFILPVVSAAEAEGPLFEHKQNMNDSSNNNDMSSPEDTSIVEDVYVPPDQNGDEQERGGEETQSESNNSNSNNNIINPDDNSDNLSYQKEEEKDDIISTSSSTLTSSPSEEESKDRIQTHYIFLVHGWLGNDSEMSYIEEAILKAKKQQQSDDSLNTDRIVTYSVKSNNGKTSDGVANGGTRVAEEIQHYIRQDLIQHNIHSKSQEQKEEQHVSISFIANSLGGLYSRYALSILPTEFEFEFQSSSFTIHLHPTIFCTTVTPHLGVASNTFLKLPRFMEHVVGNVMMRTGRELFRVDSSSSDDSDEDGKNENKNYAGDGDDNSDDYDIHKHTATDLIYKMSVEDKFIRPLLAFRKRIAYINSFGSDFQVPTATAAFLDKKSDYPHSVLDTTECETIPTFVTAMVKTETNHDIITAMNKEWYENKSTHLIMSNKLDALGWTKVFIDTRDKIPLPSFNKINLFRKKETRTHKQIWDDFIESKRVMKQKKDDKGYCDCSDNDTGMKVIATIESKDMYQLLTSNDKVQVPAGHAVLVANSKSKGYQKFNAQGKPVMDKLARDIVGDLLNN